MTAPNKLKDSERWENFVSKVSQFTEKQKEAIILFLEYQEYEKQNYPTNDATKALQSYWKISNSSTPNKT